MVKAKRYAELAQVAGLASDRRLVRLRGRARATNAQVAPGNRDSRP